MLNSFDALTTAVANRQQLLVEQVACAGVDFAAALRLADPHSVSTWVRHNEGFVAWGETARATFRGKDRFRQAQQWWQELVAGLSGVDRRAVRLLASFGFSDSDESVLLVPEFIYELPQLRPNGGVHQSRVELTANSSAAPTGKLIRITRIATLDNSDSEPATAVPPKFPTDHGTLPDSAVPETAHPVPLADLVTDIWEKATDLAPEVGVELQPETTFAQWEALLQQAAVAFGEGSLYKVALARTLIGQLSSDFDMRQALLRLHSTYPMCWTFAVAGLFGATPELLLGYDGGLARSRILAGTSRITAEVDRKEAAAELAGSSKNLVEHAYAVDSVTQVLQRHCPSLTQPTGPHILELPNVVHLMTEVSGVVSDPQISIFDLLAALHPSAAVGGTPTRAAMEFISAQEPVPRGRYAGPVGWVDGAGNGEFGIALRSGQVELTTEPDQTSRVRLYAGCGIVAGSDITDEWNEAEAKFVPMREALR